MPFLSFPYSDCEKIHEFDESGLIQPPPSQKVAGMLSLEQAVEKTLASVARLEPEFVVLNEAYRRYAAQNLHANVSLPGFDNSAMDG